MRSMVEVRVPECTTSPLRSIEPHAKLFHAETQRPPRVWI